MPEQVRDPPIAVAKVLKKVKVALTHPAKDIQVLTCSSKLPDLHYCCCLAASCQLQLNSGGGRID